MNCGKMCKHTTKSILIYNLIQGELKMLKKKKPECVLPSKSWLIKNGLGDLVKAMEEHPEKFAHIPQEIP